MLAISLLLNLLFTISLNSQWQKYSQLQLSRAQGVNYSPNNKYVIIGYNDFLKIYETDSLNQYSSMQFASSNVNLLNPNHVVFSKVGNWIAFGGDSTYITFAFVQPSTLVYNPFYSIATGNNFIQDIDYSYDGNRILCCGNSKILILNTLNSSFVKNWTIQSPTSFCQYSDVDGKFGWTDGKSFYVSNSDYTLFMNYTNSSFIGGISQIKFLTGDPYPIILVNRMGIIKTAASQSNWKIINFESNFNFQSMSISKDGTQILIGGNGIIRIYSSSQFKLLSTYDPNVYSQNIFQDQYSYSDPVRRLDFSKKGNNFIVSRPIIDKVYFYKNCSSQPYILWNCTETCGDKFVNILDCDLGIGYQNDGCFDNCTVQANFICSKVNYTSICQYQKNLTIAMKSFTKNNTSNNHKIIFDVLPQLYSLSNLSVSEIGAIFSLPSKFIPSTFNKFNNQITIQFSINEDMENQQFYIDFNPSAIGIDQYFSQKIQKLQLTTQNNAEIMPLCIINNPPQLYENCSEICGDQVAYKLPCDLGIGKAHDGCNDDCTVQENFLCSINSISHQSTCYFNSHILLSLVNIIKNQTTKNSGNIILSIFPPFHSLRNLNLTEQQLNEIFVLPPQFKALSIDYEENTGELNISFIVNQQIQNGQFYIDFNPYKIGIEKYFASQSYKLKLNDSDNSKVIPFYFSNDELFSISSFIYYASIFAPIAGWFLFFLGLFSKSLPGLQTLMTFQFCSLTLHWLKCGFFMGLRYANPIKYLLGYNIVIENSNPTTSTQNLQNYSLLKKFDIDLNFFANNLNLTLLICVPFLFATCILCLLIFKQKRKNKKYEEEQTQIDKLKKKKHFIIDSLLYSLLALFIPFLEYFILFIEIGQKTHYLSWFLSLTYLLILILFLVYFYRNPYNFQTFLLSFRTHQIRFYHFYFYILSITLASIFIIKLSNMPYMSALPFLIMLTYTLILRPYLSFQENLRSSINYLAIYSFLSFNIYVLTIQNDQISSKSVYLFLVINLSFVLPTIFLLGLISSLNHCYRIFLILKSAQKNTKDKLKDQQILFELQKAQMGIKMKKIKQKNEYFKNIIIPNESILSFSNRLIRQNDINQIENNTIIGQRYQHKNQISKQQKQKIKKIKQKLTSDFQINKKPSKKDKKTIQNHPNNENPDQTFTETRQINQNEFPLKNEIQAIKNQNLFIKTKYTIQKIQKQQIYKIQQNNNIYINIYNLIQ